MESSYRIFDPCLPPLQSLGIPVGYLLVASPHNSRCSQYSACQVINSGSESMKVRSLSTSCFLHYCRPKLARKSSTQITSRFWQDRALRIGTRHTLRIKAKFYLGQQAYSPQPSVIHMLCNRLWWHVVTNKAKGFTCCGWFCRRKVHVRSTSMTSPFSSHLFYHGPLCGVGVIFGTWNRPPCEWPKVSEGRGRNRPKTTTHRLECE